MPKPVLSRQKLCKGKPACVVRVVYGLKEIDQLLEDLGPGAKVGEEIDRSRFSLTSEPGQQGEQGSWSSQTQGS